MFNQFTYKSVNLCTTSECNEIIKLYDDKRLEEINQGTDSTYRKVKITSVNLNNHKEIINAVFEANNYFFNFDLSTKIEAYFGKYETFHHYNKEHIDSRPLVDENDMQRKLSFSLLLNNDYEGGEISMSGVNLNIGTGDIVVFPSFIPHSVSTVTSGTRYVIFGFCLGPSWR